MQTQQLEGEGAELAFPRLQEGTGAIARRLAPPAAAQNLRQMERLQRQLNTNVQEALALEVGLLGLNL